MEKTYSGLLGGRLLHSGGLLLNGLLGGSGGLLGGHPDDIDDEVRKNASDVPSV